MGKAKIPLFQMELMESSGEVVAFEQEYVIAFQRPEVGWEKIKGKRKKS